MTTMEFKPAQSNQLTLREVDIADDETVDAAQQLLQASTEYFKYSRGGHVPDELVTNLIHAKFVSRESMTDTFAQTGRRFVLGAGRQVIATILVSKDPDHIFIIDKDTLNTNLTEHPEYGPAGYHNVINFAVDLRHRQLGLAGMLLDKLGEHKDEFAGRGISFRAEPPFMRAFAGIGAQHLVQYDKFSASETSQLPPGFATAQEFNDRYMPVRADRPADQLEKAKRLRYKYALVVKDLFV